MISLSVVQSVSIFARGMVGMLVRCTQLIRIVGTGLAFGCPLSPASENWCSFRLLVIFYNASGTLLIANF